MKLYSKKNVLGLSILFSTIISTTFALCDDSINPEVLGNIEQLRISKECEGCDLTNANLQRFDLNGANLRNADLRRAKFSLADLSGADLSGANLQGAKFGGADLSQCDLRGADLRGASMAGAYTAGALIDSEKIMNTPFGNDTEDSYVEKEYIADSKKIKKVTTVDSVELVAELEPRKDEIVEDETAIEKNNVLEKVVDAEELELFDLEDSKGTPKVEDEAVKIVQEKEKKKISMKVAEVSDVSLDDEQGKNVKELAAELPTEDVKKVQPMNAVIIDPIELEQENVKTTVEIVEEKVDTKVEIVEEEVDTKVEIVEEEIDTKVEIVEEEVDTKVEIVEEEVDTKVEIVEEEVDTKAEMIGEADDKVEQIIEKDLSADDPTIDEDEIDSIFGGKELAENQVEDEEITEFSDEPAEMIESSIESLQSPSQEQIAILDKIKDTKLCYDCDLSSVDLSGKNFSNARLQGTNFGGSDLSKADFEDANLKKVDFTGANLRGADLENADLYKANLTNADLTGADLEDAKLDEAILDGAIGLDEAILASE